MVKKNGFPARTSEARSSWLLAEADELVRLLEDLTRVSGVPVARGRKRIA